MTRRRGFVAGLAAFLSDVRAANHCATALESGRKPPEAALRRLGLKADVFNRLY
ncbi:hypothetical protein LQ948_18295 [Jiella sp. MQZ9-1]|uniref:Uncharacterized protein n=1 Tax=Jiella flava TaxID=2816857 RepID=A0A939G3R0_9HYPH|nr:hypothetical protein [Jiella flava]MBO0664514.1 hypothetical protein [Jiella flava]MCD2473155.1 hypothetical protein [Jiella flava]